MNQGEISGYYKVSDKEKLYFTIRLIFSIGIYGGLIFYYLSFYSQSGAAMFFQSLLLIPLALLILFIYAVKNGILIGMVRSFSVKISEKQLPEIHKIVRELSVSLNIRSIPNVYLLQAGGSLNAFAKKFFTSNYIVIYSDLLEAYYEGDTDAVEFVIAHELGHIKRSHFFKELLLAPSLLVPFLSHAYYRACELTCDNIGNHFNPKGAINGLLMLASGKLLYKNISLEAYMEQRYTDVSFWRWFTEKLLSHPNLYKRLINVYQPGTKQEKKQLSPEPEVPKTPQVKPIVEEKSIIENLKKDNHQRYMPK